MMKIVNCNFPSITEFLLTPVLLHRSILHLLAPLPINLIAGPNRPLHFLLIRPCNNTNLAICFHPNDLQYGHTGLSLTLF